MRSVNRRDAAFKGNPRKRRGPVQGNEGTATAAARLQMLFELVDGRLVPLLPIDTWGRPSLPDGDRVLDVGQASERTNLSRRELAGIWAATWGDASPELKAPPAEVLRGVGQVERALKAAGCKRVHHRAVKKLCSGRLLSAADANAAAAAMEILAAKFITLIDSYEEGRRHGG